MNVQTSLLAEVSHDEAKINLPWETSASRERTDKIVVYQSAAVTLRWNSYCAGSCSVACARLSDSIRSGNVLKAKLRRARLGKGGGGVESVLEWTNCLSQVAHKSRETGWETCRSESRREASNVKSNKSLFHCKPEKINKIEYCDNLWNDIFHNPGRKLKACESVSLK